VSSSQKRNLAASVSAVVSTSRPTRDVDLLGFGPSDKDELERIFRHLCEMAVEPDGLRFNPQTVRAQPIRKQSGYAGVRVTMEAFWKTRGSRFRSISALAMQ